MLVTTHQLIVTHKQEAAVKTINNFAEQLKRLGDNQFECVVRLGDVDVEDDEIKFILDGTEMPLHVQVSSDTMIETAILWKHLNATSASMVTDEMPVGMAAARVIAGHLNAFITDLRRRQVRVERELKEMKRVGMRVPKKTFETIKHPMALHEYDNMSTSEICDLLIETDGR